MPFVLRNYSATENARLIRVDNAVDTAIITTAGSDVAPELYRDGVLVDGRDFPPAMLEDMILKDIVDAINSFDLFDDKAIAESFPFFDPTKDKARVGVSLLSARIEKTARIAIQDYRTYRIARFLNVDDTSAETASNAIGSILRLAEKLATIVITEGVRQYVVDEIGVEPIDVEQFSKNLVYCGVIDLTLTTARG